MAVAQGWYADPWDAAHFRWWDGLAWTAHRQPRAEAQPVTQPAAQEPSLPAVVTPASAPAVAPAYALAAETVAQPAYAFAGEAAQPVYAEAQISTRPDLRDRVPAQSMLERFGESHGLGTLPAGVDPRRLSVDESTRANYLGVIGERRIADQLASLPADWTVLHSVPTGASTGHIDHIVVGPSGVFTLTTRHHPGATVELDGNTLTVNKQKQHCLQSSTNDAVRASKALSNAVGFAVPVTSAVVFVDAKQLDTKHFDATRSTRGGAELWQEHELLPQMVNAPRRLDGPQLAAVTGAAVRPGTWHLRPRIHTDATPLLRDFGVLEQAVNHAEKRGKVGARIVIICASIAALAGAAYLAWPYVEPLLPF